MKAHLIAYLIALLILMVGCGLDVRPVSPATAPSRVSLPTEPVEFVRRSWSAEADFRPLAVRQIGEKTLVLYRYDQPFLGFSVPEDGFGYSVLTGEGDGWASQQSGGTSGGKRRGISYAVLELDRETESHLVIVGETELEEVAAVTVEWGDGTSTTERVDSGIFVIVEPMERSPCVLSFVDGAGGEIRQLSLAHCR